MLAGLPGKKIVYCALERHRACDGVVHRNVRDGRLGQDGQIKPAPVHFASSDGHFVNDTAKLLQALFKARIRPPKALLNGAYNHFSRRQVLNTSAWEFREGSWQNRAQRSDRQSSPDCDLGHFKEGNWHFAGGVISATMSGEKGKAEEREGGESVKFNGGRMKPGKRGCENLSPL